MDVDTFQARAGLGWEDLPFAVDLSRDGELHSSAGLRHEMRSHAKSCKHLHCHCTACNAVLRMQS